MIDPTVLRTLCEQATPGPWEACFCEADAEWPPTVAGPVKENGNRNKVALTAVMADRAQSAADVAFIVAAREALPQLLDENAALRERVKGLDERGWELDSKLRAAESRLAALKEAAITQTQYDELMYVLDWAVREKRKQIDALHDADWVRPPEFDLDERDEQWLADFTRKGIQDIAALQVALRNLSALLRSDP